MFRALGRAFTRIVQYPANFLGKLLPDRRRHRRFWLYLRKAVAIWLDREPSTIWLRCDYPSIYEECILSLTGPTVFKGWALATRGIASVCLYCDGRLVGEAVCGIPRPDVAVLSTHIRQSLSCGFQFVLDPKKLPAGLHKLTLTAHSRDGRALSHSCTIDNRPSSLGQDPIAVRRAPYPMVDPEQVHRILLVMLDHLGDVLLGFPAIERLRELFPAAEITALVGSWSQSLARGHPSIDNVLTYDFFDASSSKPHKRLSAEEIQLIQDWLTPRCFDLAIDFRREPETRSFLRWSGARFTAGFARGRRSKWLTVALPCEFNVQERRPRRHVSQELLLLVEMIGIASRKDVCPQIQISDQDQAYAVAKLQSLLPPARLQVAIHPGSGRSIKCWPEEHFARLADRLCDQFGACVVFFGARDEVPLVERILQQMQFAEQAISVAGQFTIGQLLAAFSRFDMYIGNDSGPTHLAAALGLPTLCICSGTIDPIQWAPLGPTALTIQRRLSCSPCYLRNREECPYGVACLTELPVEDVWEGVLKLAPGARQAQVTSPRYDAVTPQVSEAT